jgi:dTDP-4-dehydrorhamnose 3,5-epimerase-like enzyme
MKKTTEIIDCGLIKIPTISDQRGELSFIQKGFCPFEINRIYFMHDIPKDSHRGGHAHKNLHQIIIAIAGEFTIQLDDGTQNKSFTLSKPNVGLYVCPMIWRDLSFFSKNTVCLVLASEVYDENDYIRNYENFLTEKLT